MSHLEIEINKTNEKLSLKIQENKDLPNELEAIKTEISAHQTEIQRSNQTNSEIDELNTQINIYQDQIKQLNSKK